MCAPKQCFGPKKTAEDLRGATMRAGPDGRSRRLTGATTVSRVGRPGPSGGGRNFPFFFSVLGEEMEVEEVDDGGYYMCIVFVRRGGVHVC